MDPEIATIVKAIAYAENGGKPNLANPSAGKTGEMKSIFQFTPGTWKAYAKQASGQDNLPMTNENEAQVVYHKIEDWRKKGYNVEQIASMWNAGEGRPDAYKQNWKGVNKQYGVAYDTPAYAKKVADYYTKFIKESPEEGDQAGIQRGREISSAMPIPQQSRPGLLPPPIVQPTKVRSATLPELAQKQARQV